MRNFTLANLDVFCHLWKLFATSRCNLDVSYGSTACHIISPGPLVVFCLVKLCKPHVFNWLIACSHPKPCNMRLWCLKRLRRHAIAPPLAHIDCRSWEKIGVACYDSSTPLSIISQELDHVGRSQRCFLLKFYQAWVITHVIGLGLPWALYWSS